MSLEDGMSAINLEMPPRVPRTEYSASRHWELIEAVTGIRAEDSSPEEHRAKARAAFIRAWNYDFRWGICVSRGIFGDLRTAMGHAVYAADGSDYSAEITCPFSSPEEALSFDPHEAYGDKDKKEIVESYNSHYRNKLALTPDCVNTTGVYVTCISGLLEIFGWEMLLTAAGLNPEKFGETAARYTSWIQQYFDALAEAEAPVVMVHDDIVWSSGAFLHPEWYRKHVFPNYKKLLAPLIESGKKILFTSDGNYTEFIDDIASCGVNGFVMEPSTDMKYIAEKYGKTHCFIGNADARVLLSGGKEEIRAEVARCMDIGKNCPGFFMAVGNHIPPNTPVENALYYNEVYEELGRR